MSVEERLSPRQSVSVQSTQCSEAVESGERPADRLLIRRSRRLVIVKTHELELAEASGNYVRLTTASSTHLMRTSLGNLHKKLDPKQFLRVHRSTIINVERLEAVETTPAGDYYLRLSKDRRLKCSRGYLPALKTFLGGFG